jgi:hypothetical protein
MFHGFDSNEDVLKAVERIEDKFLTLVDPDDIYIEQRGYMPLLHVEGLTLNEDSLVLVLHYKGAYQKVIELTLRGELAILRFHEKPKL